MRKKGANRCPQNCDPLDEEYDFTLGVESQTLPHLLFQTKPPLAVTTITEIVGSHTRSPNSKSKIDPLHQGQSGGVEQGSEGDPGHISKLEAAAAQ